MKRPFRVAVPLPMLYGRGHAAISFASPSTVHPLASLPVYVEIRPLSFLGGSRSQGLVPSLFDSWAGFHFPQLGSTPQQRVHYRWIMFCQAVALTDDCRRHNTQTGYYVSFPGLGIGIAKFP